MPNMQAIKVADGNGMGNAGRLETVGNAHP
jgi:hypothetical protein